MALQLFKIADVTVASPQANIQFASIPQGYTDLLIVASVRTNDASGSDQMLVKFNGSTSGYSARLVGGNGSSASSVSIPNYVMPNNTTGQTATAFNSGQMYIPNYTSSNNKSYSSEGVQENNATYALMWMTAGLWSNSAAITSIELYPSLASFDQNSTFTLYGVL
jgi:hypothetical protein